MNIIFGDQGKALEYLQDLYPSYVITEENAKPILDLVKAKHIRIGDPYMHNGVVFQDDNYQDGDALIIENWSKDIMNIASKKEIPAEKEKP